MITDFNKLREYVEPVNLEEYGAKDIGNYTFRLEYAKTMALIQIAQELNEIKNLLKVDGQGFIRTKLTLSE